jgi:hypothetical protein
MLVIIVYIKTAAAILLHNHWSDSHLTVFIKSQQRRPFIFFAVILYYSKQQSETPFFGIKTNYGVLFSSGSTSSLYF